MESPAFQTVSSFSSSLYLRDYSIRKTRGELKVSAQKKLEDEYPSLAADKVLRSTILRFVGVNVVLGNVCTALAVPMQEMKEPNVLRTLKLASGVIIQGNHQSPRNVFLGQDVGAIWSKEVSEACLTNFLLYFQDIVEGQGNEARDEDTVEFNYVCRRSNGYFVHSTVDQFSGESSPVIIHLDGEQIIKGLKEVLIGMKAGGKRRALIPPSVGYTSETLQPIPEEFGPRRSLLSHAKEPLIFEVQLLKIL